MEKIDELRQVLNRNVATAEERYCNARAAHGNRPLSDCVWALRGMTVGALFADCEREIQGAKDLRDWALAALAGQ